MLVLVLVLRHSEVINEGSLSRRNGETFGLDALHKNNFLLFISLFVYCMHIGIGIRYGICKSGMEWNQVSELNKLGFIRFIFFIWMQVSIKLWYKDGMFLCYAILVLYLLGE